MDLLGPAAPVITVLTFGLVRHQASAICAVVQPRLVNDGFGLPDLLDALRRDRGVAQPLVALQRAREPSGMPSLYLPVSTPDASGLQMVVP